MTLKRRLSILILVSWVTMCVPTIAGTYNQVLSIGDKAPSWKSLPGTDDKDHSLDDLKNTKVVVVVFTCNSCPYAVDVEDRLIKLHKDFADKGVAVVAINVNKVEEDKLPAMKEKAQKKKFPFVYLHDETQKIAKDYGAIFTPEFYVLDQNRKVAYMGSLDDSPDGKKEITKRFVHDAINAVLDGKTPPIPETVSIGCRVRYERTRRTRRKKVK